MPITFDNRPLDKNILSKVLTEQTEKLERLRIDRSFLEFNQAMGGKYAAKLTNIRSEIEVIKKFIEYLEMKLRE